MVDFTYLLFICIIINWFTLICNIPFIPFYRKYWSVSITTSLIAIIITVIPFAVIRPIELYNGLMNFSHMKIDSISDLLQFIVFLMIASWDSFNLIVICIVNIFFIKKNNVREERGSIPSEIKENKYVFIIACHNSSDRIKNTIEQIKNKHANSLIITSDNGSTREEFDLVANICRDLEVENIQIPKIGNKTYAQYFALKYVKKYHSDYNIAVVLDDDTLLPDTWNSKLVDTYFNDKKVFGLCFPLGVANRVNYITEAQHLEYTLAGYSRSMHSFFGSALFASGGFSAYRVDEFIDILNKHNAMFQGEDLRIGIIMHIYFSNYNIQTCGEIQVLTQAPIHLRHKKNCECGEPSLYHQRVTSWEPARFWFIKLFIRTAFYTKYWIISFMCVIEIIQIINEHIAPLYFLICMIINPLSSIKSIIICLGISIPILLIVWILLLRTEVDLYLIVTFTHIYKILYLYIRFISLIKYYFVFIRVRRDNVKILTKMEEETMQTYLNESINIQINENVVEPINMNNQINLNDNINIENRDMNVINTETESIGDVPNNNVNIDDIDIDVIDVNNINIDVNNINIDVNNMVVNNNDIDLSEP